MKNNNLINLNFIIALTNDCNNDDVQLILSKKLKKIISILDSNRYPKIIKEKTNKEAL